MADAIRADRGEFLVDPTVGDRRLLTMQPFIVSTGLDITIFLLPDWLLSAPKSAPAHSNPFDLSLQILGYDYKGLE